MLLLDVHDGDPGADLDRDDPVRVAFARTDQPPDDMSEHGRGLGILGRIAPGWRVEPDGNGKTVSFALHCAEGEPARLSA